MTKLDAKIQEVTVYASGALVTRGVSILAVGGKVPEQVEITGLPLSAFDPAVKVRIAQIDGEATVWASQVRVGLHAREPDDVPTPPSDEARKKIARALSAAIRAAERIDQEIELLGGIGVPERPLGEEGKPPPPSPMSARVALEQFCDEGIAQRIVELRRLRDDCRRLGLEKKAIEDEARRASSACDVKADDLAKMVVVNLEQGAGKLTQIELLVDYLVPGARWTPTYQIRLQRDSSAAEISHRALVTQNSGEDWRQVKLRLSTAAPLTFSELPTLGSVRIGRAQPPAARKPGFRPPPKGALGLFSDHDRGIQNAKNQLPAYATWVRPDTPITPLAPAAPRLVISSTSQARLAPPAIGSAAAPPSSQSRQDVSFGSEKTSGGAALLGAGHAPAEFDDVDALFDDDDDDSLEGAAELGIDMDLEDDHYSAEATAQYSARSRQLGSRKESAPRASAPRKSSQRARGGGRAPAHITLQSILFTSLRLGRAEDPERGSLIPIQPQESYLELLTRGRLRVTIDVMGVVRAAAEQAGASDNLPLPSGTSDVKRAKGSFDFVYDTDATIDVASDLSWHSIPVSTRAAEADVRYVVVPREDTSVFRVATLQNSLDGPLLPGPADVYVGGEYVLATQLPTVAPRGEFKLGLGVEQAIKCARRTRFSEKRSGEERVAMTELQHVIEIDLVNHLSRDAHIEVRERIPQPGPDAELVVDEQGVEPAWQAYTQETLGQPIEGGRQWTVVLGPAEKKLLTGGYVVKLYAVNELVGGNRREA